MKNMQFTPFKMPRVEEKIEPHQIEDTVAEQLDERASSIVQRMINKKRSGKLKSFYTT